MITIVAFLLNKDKSAKFIELAQCGHRRVSVTLFLCGQKKQINVFGLDVMMLMFLNGQKQKSTKLAKPLNERFIFYQEANICSIKKIKKILKKVLTNRAKCAIIKTMKER